MIANTYALPGNEGSLSLIAASLSASELYYKREKITEQRDEGGFDRVALITTYRTASFYTVKHTLLSG